MGYSTAYRLSIIGVDQHDTLRDIILSDEINFYALKEDGSPADMYTWYDHEETMRYTSKRHPDLIFKLEGEGEGAGDIWIKYFKDGKMQECRAKITFDEYDEARLV
ncbi:hypothetical protein AAXB25_14450 [Paenibacillus lautus]|uniref:hypothetical protein n=1 Tax=Paenibacillus lautus TaxID=1401 RepID=UPI003D28F311